jgi:hypothetical protein
MRTFQKITIIILAFAGFWNVGLKASPDEKPSLNQHLEPFRPMLEKTFSGTFKDSKPDKPTVDVQHWERALNGKAVRLTHSINNGVYGGETLFVWDEKKQSVAYYYFTTADFMTTGTISFEGSKWIAHETVSGDPDGVTEVRSISELMPDGALHVKAEYFKKGEWAPGHEATYREDANAKVVFK